MTYFSITEDFPNIEIESESGFSVPKACYAYLIQAKVAWGLCMLKNAVIEEDFQSDF